MAKTRKSSSKITVFLLNKGFFYRKNEKILQKTCKIGQTAVILHRIWDLRVSDVKIVL
jgi:hypothetical protein